MTTLESVEQVTRRIEGGRPLLVAGHEDLLRRLPRGPWVGGTIPYFMTEDGGVECERRVLVTELPRQCTFERSRLYSAEALPELPGDYPADGLSFIIVPAGGEALSRFAHQGPNWPGFFDRPLVGWVAGVALEKIGAQRPLVFDGVTGACAEDAAVVMHLGLEAGWSARADIINLFQAAPGGDVLTFPADGFSATDCRVNGEPARFADYLSRRAIDTRLPLVADYSGAAINVSIQAVDEATGTVSFFAPVVEGVEYRFAAPLTSYRDRFQAEVARRKGVPFFSCDCVLNYLYASLHGVKTPGALGPFTFGEIAWMLLNQTVVYVTLEQKDRS
jgi:hypothetical protein